MLQSLLYKLITIRWRRTVTIYLLFVLSYTTFSKVRQVRRTMNQTTANASDSTTAIWFQLGCLDRTWTSWNGWWQVQAVESTSNQSLNSCTGFLHSIRARISMNIVILIHKVRARDQPSYHADHIKDYRRQTSFLFDDTSPGIVKVDLKLSPLFVHIPPPITWNNLPEIIWSIWTLSLYRRYINLRQRIACKDNIE